ncbi:MAG: PEGA domain-containing protein, partial [Myxococcota bacterium]
RPRREGAKGRRASEARRAAEQKAPPPPVEPEPIEPDHTEDTVAGGVPPPVEPPREEISSARKVVVPVPDDVAQARPDEPTRRFDPRTDLPQPPQRPAAPSAARTVSKPRVPKAEPPPRRRSVLLLAIASSLCGAAVAVALGLVWVRGSGAKPARDDRPPPKAVPLPEKTEKPEKPAETPPTPPPTESVAFLQLLVDPVGAVVEVDGSRITNLDAALSLKPGAHRLRVTAPGYVEDARTITLTSGARDQVSISLTPQSAKPPPEQRPKPAENPKPPPDETERPSERPKPAERPKPTPRQEKPAPRGVAKLKLTAPGTWATITLDGKKLTEVTPAVLTVPAGEHTVVITHGPSKESRTFKVDLAPNEEKMIKAEF